MTPGSRAVQGHEGKIKKNIKKNSCMPRFFVVFESLFHSSHGARTWNERFRKYFACDPTQRVRVAFHKLTRYRPNMT